MGGFIILTPTKNSLREVEEEFLPPVHCMISFYEFTRSESDGKTILFCLKGITSVSLRERERERESFLMNLLKHVIILPPSEPIFTPRLHVLGLVQC